MSEHPIDLETLRVAARAAGTLAALAHPDLALLLGALPRRLGIGGRRSFGYESVYFDTPDRLTFRQHRQGRRRRFKIRTRTYTGSGDCTFEVKLEGWRGATIKHRSRSGPAASAAPRSR